VVSASRNGALGGASRDLVRCGGWGGVGGAPPSGQYRPAGPTTHSTNCLFGPLAAARWAGHPEEKRASPTQLNSCEAQLINNLSSASRRSDQ
jgi:hypothetical protein